MVRRWLLMACLVLLALACLSSPALAAYGPLWSQPVDGAARLVSGGDGTTAVWAAAEGGGTSALLAMRYSRAGDPLAATPQTLVSGIADLGGWVTDGDNSRHITVVWKDGGAISATRVEMGGGALYGPVVVCTDAAVAALRGSGATAAPVQVLAGGDGGAFVRLAISPSSGSGDTLLDHVSPLGVAAVADPGLPVPQGTVADMAGDAAGRLFVLLAPPGRTGMAVQRYSSDLVADWDAPVSPYDPLFGLPPAVTPEPLGIIATSSATAAWREGTKVQLQRFSASGTRLWLRPTGVTMAGAVTLAGDAYVGCYLVGPSGDGIVARHILSSGLEADAPGSRLTGLGLGLPRIDGISWNRAGDLSVAYSDAAASPGNSGVAHLTFLGEWTGAGLDPAPERFAGLGGDGAGGTYALGAGAGAALWHVGQSGLAVTFRPRAQTVKYGKSVGVSGYLTSGGEPLAGRTVTLRKTSGGVSSKAGTATTDDQGFYRTTVAPAANSTWFAEAGGVSSAGLQIGVVPGVTLALSHTRSGARFSERFSGKVTPAHRGTRVLVQSKTGGGWHTVRAGTVDARSRYHVTWKLPDRTATYSLRVIIPAHADHLQGTSPTATLRIVVKKG
jgi:hypothetical protein